MATLAELLMKNQQNPILNQTSIMDSPQPAIYNNPSINSSIDTPIANAIMTPQTYSSPIMNEVNNTVQTPTFTSWATMNAPTQSNGFLSGLRDLQTGFKDNYENRFNVNNLKADPNKGWMEKIGEGIGTTARFLNGPTGRGLLAGGAALAMGGGLGEAAGYGLGTFAGRQAVGTQNQAFRNELENMGVDTSGVGGNITSDIYSPIATSRRLQNAQMTVGQLASMGNQEAIQALAQSPELENKIVSPSVANSLITGRPQLTEAQINKIAADTGYITGAKTDKTKSDIVKNQANINKINSQIGLNNARAEDIKAGGTGGGSGNVIINNTPRMPSFASGPQETVLMKSPDGRIFNVPQNQIQKYKDIGGVLVNG